MRWIAASGMALMLAGCATTGGNEAPPSGPIPTESESIRYQTSGCFGRCPVYQVTVRPDGTGTFVGERFTQVSGERDFTLTSAEYEAFKAKLAPYRPESGMRRIAPGTSECENVATDLPSVDISWTRPIGDSQSLYFYYGCDMEENAQMAQDLGEAAELLPIQKLVGAQP
ncbi:DUF6438 domain-containing protein [Stakelama tenebrarum]|uniref:DUF6438 domain-containing protein n=1 Tax=Stakelama tenebrarum TaxID=2711215 RepID=A0A6G6Y3E4_9SPHN|nr:DUF6438 domain-containing protein [Sphingosinithalassobacter tenebrarum]QIG79420.1 hypothetical protein G5C33_06200 [Sphingosinithalassobacter tenebrarum]